MFLWEAPAPLLSLGLHRADWIHSTGCIPARPTIVSHPFGQRMAGKYNVTQMANEIQFWGLC